VIGTVKEATYQYLLGTRRPPVDTLVRELTRYALDGVGRRAEPEERNALRLPDSYQLDARLNYAISLPKGIGKIGISFTNLFDHRNVNDRFFAIEEYEEEEQEIVPVDVLDFGFRMSFDFQVRF